MPKTMQEGAIVELLDRGISRVVEREALERLLASGKKLRVKLGIDPTAPDLHLGHAVVLRKLREFQDLGHKVVLIIGDFTGQIGDPSGKSKTRPALSEGEVNKNMKTFLAQAGKVIDVKKTEVRRNGEWYRKGGIRLLLSLAQVSTVQQVLKREDFKKRIDEGNDVSLLETLYAVLQGYDSVAIKADVELGGDDQLLNLLSGRRVQRHFSMAEQQVMTMPLLVGLDGTQKMSKSLGNYVGLTDTPDDMFGKLMSVPDAAMPQYFELCTSIGAVEVHDLITRSPRDAKARLAFEVVKQYHGEKKAEATQEKWEKIFSKKEISAEELPELKLNKNSSPSIDVVMMTKVPKSRSEGWRLIEQSAVSVDGAVLSNTRRTELRTGQVLKIGKRHFFRIKIGA